MILEVDRVVAGYGDIEVLHRISLQVSRGELACIIGPNGSGKSTLFRTIMGFVSPRSGQIRFEGQEISGLRPYEVIRRGLACVLQGRTVFAEMTVRENLEVGGYSIRGDRFRFRRNFEMVLEVFPPLKDRLGARAGTLSGGQQQMVEMGRALMLNPHLLLLDEPTLGLAPNVSAEVLGKVKEMNEGGLTVVVVEQNAQHALEIAHRAFVLDLGEINMVGPGPEILGNQQVRKLYLGAA